MVLFYEMEKVQRNSINKKQNGLRTKEIMKNHPLSPFVGCLWFILLTLHETTFYNITPAEVAVKYVSRIKKNFMFVSLKVLLLQ